MAETIEGLSKAFDAMSELQKTIKCEKSVSIFKELSKTMSATSQHFLESGELIKLYNSSHLKYHLEETEGYQDMLAYRETCRANFTKKEKTVLEKKEKLFAQKDVTKWGCHKDKAEELLLSKESILLDKKRAFMFMLATETAEMLAMKDELNYITNQCLYEARRVGKDNGDLLVDHFLTMS